MAEKDSNPLASLSQEQIAALLDKLRAVTQPATASKPSAPALVVAPQIYWHVVDGYFETTIDGRDAASAEIAFDKAQDTKQPWFFHGHFGELQGHSKAITRNEYIDWLRR